MLGIPLARVVAVIADTESGARQVGSGYLLDATRVLTAWHCTFDSKTKTPAIRLRVARLSGGATVAVVVREAAPRLDVALLEVTGTPHWDSELPSDLVKFGKVSRERTGELDGCEAVGFPRWREEGHFRDHAPVRGIVRLSEGAESHRLVLRDPLLAGVSADGGSAWAGFSGASVFYDGLLLGVVIEHHPGQGDTALQIRSAEAIAADGDDAARRLAGALGIDRPGALRLVTAKPRGWRAEDAGEAALAQWGWSLERDPEGVRHWRPRACGVSINREKGWRFRGRTKALNQIVLWLGQETWDRRVLVVTGSPGAGKSAVLGRIVTTADSAVRASLPPEDTSVCASVGSVHCAVHAKGKTALEVAAEIARAASAENPERIEDFAPVLEEAFQNPDNPGRQGRFNVIIDALDEAVNPEQTREIVQDVILVLAEAFADDGGRVVVGTRRTDAGDDDLLGTFGNAALLLDLDEPGFFAPEDLASYTLATLQLAGAERPGNPYANDDAAARSVANRIAELSEKNFLIAGLTARDHAMRDTVAADPATLSFTATVESALRKYLRRVPVPAVMSAASPHVTATALLTALAFAEAPGFSSALWRKALQALRVGDVSEDALTEFARSAAASFLVEFSGPGEENTAFRLFHQALGDALLSTRARFFSRTDDERKLVRTFLQFGRDVGWGKAPEYLLRALPGHATRAELTDDLLADDTYLLHADLRRVIRAGAQQRSMTAQDRARLLGLTPEAITVGPAERAAMFSVTETMLDLSTAYRENPQSAPYRARWAVTVPSHENLTLKPASHVQALCVVPVEDRILLATAGSGSLVHLWDPVDGTRVRVLEGHSEGHVASLCVVQVQGRTLLAAGGTDSDEDDAAGLIQLWDPVDGTRVRVIQGHTSRVGTLCVVSTGSRSLLAAGDSAGFVRLWDPATGNELQVLSAHTHAVWAVCPVLVENRTLLATAGADNDSAARVQLWDPANGTWVRTIEDQEDGVMVMCTVQVGNRALLATASMEASPVRLRDPVTGIEIRSLDGHAGGVGAVCEVQVGDRVFLATVGSYDDGPVRLWDPVDGAQVRILEGHRSRVWEVSPVRIGDRTFLATAGSDKTVRLWDLDLREGQTGRNGQVRPSRVQAACPVRAGNQTLLAAAGVVRPGKSGDRYVCELLVSLPDSRAR